MSESNRAIHVNTNCGGYIILSEEDCKKIQLFADILEFTSDIQPRLDVLFSELTVRTYLFWCQNNDLIDILNWEFVVELFLFANFAGCTNFITFFVRKILPRILSEDNTCHMRFLLSISQNQNYLGKDIEHDDEWDYSHECTALEAIDAENEFDSMNDNILTLIPLKEFRWIFPRLSIVHRYRLVNLIPRTHQYGLYMRMMFIEYRYVMHKERNYDMYVKIKNTNFENWHQLVQMIKENDN